MFTKEALNKFLFCMSTSNYVKRINVLNIFHTQPFSEVSRYQNYSIHVVYRLIICFITHITKLLTVARLSNVNKNVRT